MKRLSPKQWTKIRNAYQRGEGSCRELAEKFGLSEHTVGNRCKREKWVVAKAELDQKMAEKTEEALVEAMALGAQAWVAHSIQRAQRGRKLLDTSLLSFAPAEGDPEKTPVVDMLNLRTMAHAEQMFTDMGRQAFGIPDAPKQVQHSGTIIYEIIDPYAQGKTIDIEPAGDTEDKG